MKITLIICLTIILIVWGVCATFEAINREDNEHVERKNRIQAEYEIEMEKIKRGIKND